MIQSNIEDGSCNSISKVITHYRIRLYIMLHVPHRCQRRGRPPHALWYAFPVAAVDGKRPSVLDLQSTKHLCADLYVRLTRGNGGDDGERREWWKRPGRARWG